MCDVTAKCFCCVSLDPCEMGANLGLIHTADYRSSKIEHSIECLFGVFIKVFGCFTDQQIYYTVNKTLTEAFMVRVCIYVLWCV